ncbi:MAG: hypothetical protein QOD92_3931 [Acidimicrobiaceae bacterium]|jgi:hypothetical protein
MRDVQDIAAVQTSAGWHRVRGKRASMEVVQLLGRAQEIVRFIDDETGDEVMMPVTAITAFDGTLVDTEGDQRRAAAEEAAAARRPQIHEVEHLKGLDLGHLERARFLLQQCIDRPELSSRHAPSIAMYLGANLGGDTQAAIEKARGHFLARIRGNEAVRLRAALDEALVARGVNVDEAMAQLANART